MLNAASQSAPTGAPAEYRIGDLVTVRVLDANPDNAAAVSGQLGPPVEVTDHPADVVVRFVDRIDLPPAAQLVGLDCAYGNGGFFFLQGPQKARARTQLPLDRIGLGGEILCERAAPSVPLLIAAVNVAMLAKGRLPLHGSAFSYGGRRVLVTGWSKGGKTELLLSATSAGAQYIADEWTYLAADGKEMFGLPEPVRLWAWQLAQLPEVRARLGSRRRTKLRVQTLIADAFEQASARSAATVLARAAALAANQPNVRIPPEDVFGPRLATAGGPDLLVLGVSHDHDSVEVRRTAAEQIARRMAHSLEEERAALMAAYRKFRFAFPDRAHPILDDATDRERQLLSSALEGLEAVELVHPYRVELPRLFAALEPYLRQERR